MAIQLPRVNLPDRQESLLTRKSLVILNMLLHERIVGRYFIYDSYSVPIYRFFTALFST